MAKYFLISYMFLAAGLSYAQIDNVGSGMAIHFDGVNDYIHLGNIYDNLILPVTISAWIKLENTSSFGGIFASQDNLPLYNGFQFVVSPTTLSIEYGDGNGENLSEFRRSKGASISNISNRWVHVAATMRGPTDMDLFVNGVNVGGNYSGSSDLPMSSNSPGDVAKIGLWSSNGEVFYFDGQMDELTIWNKSLTLAELRSNMCKKLIGNESGLIGYWSFDEMNGATVFDMSTNDFNGILQNSPTRVYSGAAIGDESVNHYTGSWAGTEVIMTEGTHMIKVSNINGNLQGVHIYAVHSLPSQTGGLDVATLTPLYFGVFAAALDVNNTFNVSNDGDFCGFFERKDNSEAVWTDHGGPLIGIVDRNEFIAGAVMADLGIDLGPDELICPFTPRTLSPLTNPSGYQFLWQDGSTHSTFQVADYGEYWVQISNACQMDRDTITFSKQELPLSIDLGVDELICPLKPRTLSPLANPTGFEFTWQDGSKQSSFQVLDYGTYWVTVQNSCSIASDTITIAKLELHKLFIPNVITPNNDSKNQFFVLDQQLVGSRVSVYNRWGKSVFESLNYQNNWDGRDLPDGIYFYYVSNPCTDNFKGTLSIFR